MEIKVRGVVNSSDNNLAYIVSDDARASVVLNAIEVSQKAEVASSK